MKYCENALIFYPDHIFANQYLAQINQLQEIKDNEAALKQLEQTAQKTLSLCLIPTLTRVMILSVTNRAFNKSYEK